MQPDQMWFFCVQLDDERVTVLQTVAPDYPQAFAKLMARNGEAAWPLQGKHIREVLHPSYEQYLASQMLIS